MVQCKKKWRMARCIYLWSNPIIADLTKGSTVVDLKGEADTHGPTEAAPCAHNHFLPRVSIASPNKSTDENNGLVNFCFIYE